MEIISFSLILIGLIICAYLMDSTSFCPFIALTGIFLGVFIANSINEMNTQEIPTALDVYQGKTTLQITYQDSVAVDTVVVFKKK